MSGDLAPQPCRSASHLKYRPDIDGLRAVAVLSVMAFHAFPRLVAGGFVGVDVFFVVSGYLISSIIFASLENDRFSFIDFYARRIRRIFPALALVLVACWIWGWFALFASDYERLGKHTAAGAGFVANFALWGEAGYFDAAAARKPLLHLWSLGVEEQFYLVWPALLYVAWRLKRNLLTVTAVILVVSFLVNVVRVRTDEIAAFYSPVTRFWELLVGAALAHVVMWGPRATSFPGRSLEALHRVLRGPYRNVAAMAGLAGVTLAVLTFDGDTSFPGWRAGWPVGGSLLIIAAGPDAWLNRHVLSSRGLVWIGLLSYPLYLWHWPLLSFSYLAASGGPTVVARSTALVASVVLAWMTYRIVERPLRFEWSRGRAVTTLAAAMTMACAVGYVTFRADGFMDRPVNRSDVAHFLQYYDHLHREGLREAYRAECDFRDWDTEEPRESIAVECTAKGDTGTVFLWGDSYAQALSFGLRGVLPGGVRLAQVTTSGCAPRLLGAAPQAPSEMCARANAYALARIADLKPEAVVLAQILGHEGTNWEALAHDLRARGAGSVILVGPAPQWFPTLPEVIVKHHWGTSFERVAEGLSAENIATDRMLSDRLATSSELQYVSLIGALCNTAGCRATVPATDNQLMAVDSGHLSPDGSLFVARTVLQRFLPQH